MPISETVTVKAPARGTEQACPVCGSTSFEPLAALRDNRTGAFERSFRVARCVGCDLVALRPQPEPTELATGYDVGYGPYDRPGDWDAGRAGLRGTAVRAARRLWHIVDGHATIDRIPVHGRVLDVGAGRGDDVEYLLRKGHDAVGLEPNPRAVEACTARGVPVVLGTLESANLEPESLDTVLLNQVLEHLIEPRDALQVVSRILRPGGSLVLLTPNVAGLPARMFGQEWAHWHVPYHVYLYGPTQLRRLLGETGFDVVRLFTVTPGFWVNMSLQLHLRQSQKSGWVLPQDAWQASRIARLAVAPLLRMVDVIGRGDCLIAVSTRR